MSMVFDEARGVCVLFGGALRSDGTFFYDTQLYDGTKWNYVVTGTNTPEPRASYAMTYDRLRQRVVLFGGGSHTDTWEWDGLGWQQKALIGPGPASSCCDAGMVFDDASGLVLRFNNVDGSTWSWDGISWTKIRTDTSMIGAGYGPRSMVFDADRQAVLLLGSSCQSELAPGAAWEWDGTQWNRLSADLPSPRQSFAVYHPVQHRVLIFSGWDPAVPCSGVLAVQDSIWSLRNVLILQQPTSANYAPGSTAMFSVVATGTNLSYVWRHNSIELSDGGRISGSKNPALVISGVQSADQGQYDCLVISPSGIIESQAAELSCVPVIVQQPPARAGLKSGVQLTFAVPSPAPYSYRWRQNSQNLFNIPGLITGATSRTLTLLTPDPSLNGTYDCVITDVCGTVVTTTTRVCLADLNADDFVDDVDFVWFAADYDTLVCSDPAMSPDCPSDFNGDGIVDDGDFVHLVGAYQILLCS